MDFKDDLKDVNRIAEQQISRLEAEGALSPSVTTNRGNFWGNAGRTSEADKFRPSSTATSVPLLSSSAYPSQRFYTTRGNDISASSPEMLYRRTMAAVYRADRTGTPSKPVIHTTAKPAAIVEDNMIKVDVMGDDLLGVSSRPRMMLPQQNYMAAPAGPPKIGDTAKMQLTAIVLSSITRMITIMVGNWARDRSVPFEIL